jgi:hypothetical protein
LVSLGHGIPLHGSGQALVGATNTFGGRLFWAVAVSMIC